MCKKKKMKRQDDKTKNDASSLTWTFLFPLREPPTGSGMHLLCFRTLRGAVRIAPGTRGVRRGTSRPDAGPRPQRSLPLSRAARS